MRKISFGGLKPVLIFCMTITVILTLSRFALSVWLYDRVSDASGWGPIFL